MNKHKIDNWGARELKAGAKIFKKLKDFFAGIGLAFTTAIFVLGFSILVLWGFYLLRQFIESRIASSVISSLNFVKNPESPASPTNPPQPEAPGQSAAMESSIPINVPQPSDGLIYAGYTDLFSGVGGLNQSETTMYRDNVTTAFMFSPSLQWSEKSGNAAAPDFSSACINGSCLSVNGTILILNGSPVKLPVADNIDNVTADVVDNAWAVGIVVRNGGEYDSYIYLFDGSSFIPITNPLSSANNPRTSASIVTSQYEGQWGFGGTADDFLAVYGAYQGKGFRIRIDPRSHPSESASITDISGLFDVRVMNGGIRPGIIRVSPPGNPRESASIPTWYLFNKDRNNHAIFVKLFQNGTADIAGEADLSGTFPSSFSYLTVTSVSNSFPFLLSVYGERAGSPQNWSVVDKGFKIPSAPVAVISVNLNNYPNTEVPYLINLVSKDFSAGGASISFEVRNKENGAWEVVSPGADHWFSDPHGPALEWRMKVTPGVDPEYTPYLDSLLVEYKVKRF